MWWHTDRDNLVIFVVLIKFSRDMALMSIQDEYLICALCLLFSMLVEVLNLF
jgi:hypothetical protein